MFKVGDLVTITRDHASCDNEWDGLGIIIEFDKAGQAPCYFVHTCAGYAVWCWESELSKPNEK